ncbi:MAG: hypothetical protein ACE5J3_12535 [Methanosarcinales archaeon]
MDQEFHFKSRYCIEISRIELDNIIILRPILKRRQVKVDKKVLPPTVSHVLLDCGATTSVISAKVLNINIESKDRMMTVCGVLLGGFIERLEFEIMGLKSVGRAFIGNKCIDGKEFRNKVIIGMSHIKDYDVVLHKGKYFCLKL